MRLNHFSGLSPVNHSNLRGIKQTDDAMSFVLHRAVIAAANILPSLQHVQHARPPRRCHCPAHGGGDNDAIAQRMSDVRSDVRSFGARSELPDVRRRR